MKCLSIHITDLCNSQCTFCVVASPLYAKDSVDYQRVIEFLEENKDRGFDVVNLHGGEPTVHPHFEQILQTIRDCGYPEVHVQTNGIRLSDSDFAARGVGLGISKFIVSLHGDSPESQDSLTLTRGGFLRTLAGIRNVKSLGALVRTNTVITVQNLRRLPAITRLACDLGVDHMNFSNLHPVGSARFGLGRILPTLTEVVPFLDEAIALALAAERRVTLEGFPYCAVPGREDLQLNNDFRQIKMLFRGEVIEDYDVFMNDVMRVFGPPCEDCEARTLCGGVYPEYIAYRGWSEFAPLKTRLPEAARVTRDRRKWLDG